MTGVLYNYTQPGYKYPYEIHFSWPVTEELKQLVLDLEVGSMLAVHINTYILFFPIAEQRDAFATVTQEQLNIRIV